MKKIFNKKIFFLCLGTIIFLAVSCNKNPGNTIQVQNSGDYATPLTVGNKKILVEVVSTPVALTLGLSGRQQLTDEQGMLFIFSGLDTKRPGFWMKDMKFNLDFIWINQNRIVGITKNVPAPVSNRGLGIKDAKLPLYYPPSDVDEVLEVSGGWSDKYKISVGDEVSLSR